MKKDLTKEEIISNLKKGMQIATEYENESILYGWVRGLLEFLGESEEENYTKDAFYKEFNIYGR